MRVSVAPTAQLIVAWADPLSRVDANRRHAPAPADLRMAGRADETLDRKLLAERGREGLDRPPDNYLGAIVLRDLKELSTDEVAELLGIDSTAARPARAGRPARRIRAAP